MPNVFIIMGVTGSGKTTIGQRLASRIHVPFIDADDFHSDHSREKMKAGQPLTDEDRIPWLQAVAHEIVVMSNAEGGIVACSALKEAYRSVLSAGHSLPVIWVYLKGNYDLIRMRLSGREGHYMNPVLLQSQYDILEEPAYGITIDVHQSLTDMEEAILKAAEV